MKKHAENEMLVELNLGFPVPNDKKINLEMHVYYKIHRLRLQFIDIINSLIMALCYKTHDKYLALNLFRIIGFFFYLKKNLN